MKYDIIGNVQSSEIARSFFYKSEFFMLCSEASTGKIE